MEPAITALGKAKEKAPLKGKQPVTSHLEATKAARELESAAHKWVIPSFPQLNLGHHHPYTRIC